MISVIPERVISQALKDGLNLFRSNYKMLAILFQNLTDPEFERIVSFVSKAPIGIQVNYPRTEVSAPCLVLLMKSEQEEITFLGDHMGTTPNYGMPPQEHLYDTSEGHSASISGTTGLGVKIAGPLPVLSCEPSRVWVANDVEKTEDLFMYVVSGTGRGQKLQILSVTEQYLDLDGVLDIILDTTSRIDIRGSDQTLFMQGEPARVYNYGDVVSRKGAYYSANYVLDVIAGSQEEVIYLYTVVRAILFLFKASLEAQGIQNLSLSGSDFVPRNEYLPDVLFHRNLNLQFTYPFSVIVEEDVIRQLELCIEETNGYKLSLGTIQLGDADEPD